MLLYNGTEMSENNPIYVVVTTPVPGVMGVSGAVVTSANMSGGVASVTDAPTSGQKIVLDSVTISVGTTMRVDFKEETSGTIVLTVYMAANDTKVITQRIKLATADKKLQAITSASGNISIATAYHSEA